MSEPFKVGDKVLVEAKIVRELDSEGDVFVETQIRDGIPFGVWTDARAVRPLPPEPDGRAFRVRDGQSGQWIVRMLPVLSPDMPDAARYSPIWRPIFEAGDRYEIHPIDPEPEPAVDPVAEAERELIEAALACESLVESPLWVRTQERFEAALAAVREARRQAGKEAAK